MSMRYNTGDKVRIVNYGHIILISHKIAESTIWKDYPHHGKDGLFERVDVRPDLIGREGIVSTAEITQGVPSYSINGIGAWYNEDQLEMVYQNPVNAIL